MDLSKDTVLVIDDQPGIRRLLTEILEDEGYKIITAANGYEGVQKAKENEPAVILMDMKMPGMDGLEALKEVSTLGQGDRVVMMTAYGELDMINEAKAAGVQDYITKPFDIVTLCGMVKKGVDNFRNRQAGLIGMNERELRIS